VTTLKEGTGCACNVRVCHGWMDIRSRLPTFLVTLVPVATRRIGRGCPGVGHRALVAFGGVPRPMSDASSVLRPGRSTVGWVMLAGRLLLGGVWIAAGAAKLPDPAGSVRAVRAYQVLPEAIVPVVGFGLPVLEVALGLLLVLGVAVRFGAILSAFLLVAFIAGVSSAWARGLAIDCGCFGGGGAVAADRTRYGIEILRDSALLLVAVALARWPASRLALVPHTAALELAAAKEG